MASTADFAEYSPLETRQPPLISTVKLAPGVSVKVGDDARAEPFENNAKKDPSTMTRTQFTEHLKRQMAKDSGVSGLRKQESVNPMGTTAGRPLEMLSRDQRLAIMQNLSPEEEFKEEGFSSPGFEMSRLAATTENAEVVIFLPREQLYSGRVFICCSVIL